MLLRDPLNPKLHLIQIWFADMYVLCKMRLACSGCWWQIDTVHLICLAVAGLVDFIKEGIQISCHLFAGTLWIS